MASVTIIGAGKMARGVGTRLLAGGADVQILAPTAEEATSLAAELGSGDGSVTGGEVQERLTGDVVVLATPYDAALDLARTRGEELAGKVVVDITGFLPMALQEQLGTGYGSTTVKIVTP